MKKLCGLLFACLFILRLGYSQDDDRDIQTLLNSKVQISAFGAPIFSFANIHGESTYLNGGGGAVLFNRTFFLGAYGISSNQGVRMTDAINSSLLRIKHGGFWLGYDFFPKKIVHPATSLKIGWGNATLSYDDSRDSEYFRDAILVIEPGLGLEMNVTKFLKFGVNGSYRFVQNDEDIKQYNVDDLDGFSLNLNLKFGWFN